MSLRIPSSGAAAHAALAVAGLVGLLAFSSWPAATAFLALALTVAVARARRAEAEASEWRRRSEHDPLTGVGNYRKLHERLHAATAHDPERFALLTLDVDRFKEINEAHGHLEGDRLLQEVGRVLTENVRGTDVVARQGGDEFSVLMPGSTEEGAAMLAARIEDALATISAADQAPVRASIGVAMYPQDGATPDDLLEKADLELRITKERRRAASVPASSGDDTVAAWTATPSQA
ncbi:MAG TPA: GGDEF domain-containing protein [Baekduia sp.]|uniref:GGDEF domain-containing protein n=1 Tax=Baekduia sp. TaxID=2600305 RepID=UPI002D79BCCE|nr:GGDEF domain-containing protein [Baekduia sp.]HET6507649.1 GGDEF domain-containing protein [Baekduia sp.]